jgi:hypothetical protein
VANFALYTFNPHYDAKSALLINDLVVLSLWALTIQQQGYRTCDLFNSIALLYLNIFLLLSLCFPEWNWLKEFNFYFYLVCFVISTILTIAFGYSSPKDHKTTGPYEVGYQSIFTKKTK